MTKQKQQPPQQNEQQQNTSQRGKNLSNRAVGTRRGNRATSRARRASQGHANRIKGLAASHLHRALRTHKKARSVHNGEPARRPVVRRRVSRDESGREQSDQSGDKLRRGALDAQYGTSSSSKTGQKPIGHKVLRSRQARIATR